MDACYFPTQSLSSASHQHAGRASCTTQIYFYGALQAPFASPLSLRPCHSPPLSLCLCHFCIHHPPPDLTLHNRVGLSGSIIRVNPLRVFPNGPGASHSPQPKDLAVSPTHAPEITSLFWVSHFQFKESEREDGNHPLVHTLSHNGLSDESPLLGDGPVLPHRPPGPRLRKKTGKGAAHSLLHVSRL